MKLSVTEAFLWDVYKFLEGSGNVLGVIFNPHPRIGDFWAEKNPIFKKYQKDLGRRNFGKLIYYLKKNNFIKVKNLKGKKGVILTKEGMGKALKASFKVDSKNKRKDGKWIMLIFDIPETRIKDRNLLKSIIRNLGYKLFQQSVWVTPYDVFDKTEKLLQLYYLDKYVKIFLIEEM